jgi:hypothetical protein
MTETGQRVWRAAGQRESHTPEAEAVPQQSPYHGDAPGRADKR